MVLDRGVGDWPALAYADWRDTAATFHIWTQIVGKLRLANTPWTNHSWHCTLYVTARGLGTSLIPDPRCPFQIDFDFIDHKLVISASNGERRELALRDQTTADFYRDLMANLEALDLPARIHGRPNEVVEAIPFAEDRVHGTYDPEAAARFWRALLQVNRVFTAFRARFIGKCSPPHFFWGSFDFAVTRFSGRPAPEHPGGFPNLPDWITREAYSHECSSAGFWTGSDEAPEPIFYSYAYPTPAGFGQRPVEPSEAFWSESLGEFVLPYEAVRKATDPDATLLAFLESSYRAAAETGSWDLEALALRLPEVPAS
jgi:hypothetical protein